MKRAILLGGLSSMLLSSPAIADVKTECINASEEAQRLRDDGTLLAARESLLFCVRDECPQPVREACHQWLVEVDREVPTVVFAVRDRHGRDTTRVRVLVDGKLVAETLDGRAVRIDPGRRLVRFEVESLAPIENVIVVRAGEKNRLVSADFAAGVEPSRPPPPPPPPPGTSSEAQVAAGPGVVPVVLGVAGLLSLGAFAYFGWTGKSALDDMRDGCGATRSCSPSDVEAAERHVLVGDVFLGAGVVSLGAATYLWLASPASDSSGTSQRPSSVHLFRGVTARWSTRF
jgi:hypothetical protein